MRSLLIAVCTLNPAVAAVAAPSDDDADQRKAAVERGLRARTMVEGVGWTIAERLAHYRVPGVSIAVIRDFEIDWASGYGLRDPASGALAGIDTVFQAASISKPLAATTLLRLAEADVVDLDADVRGFLESWELPENDFARAHELTFAHLLSHTGGTTVHGFGGYSRYDDVPTLSALLDGRTPANSPAVVLDRAPGEGYRYSGGGLCIAQCAMVDATGESFPDLARRLVFDPLGMARSSYRQPLSREEVPDHAIGHLGSGARVPGGFHTYPEMAAAGLWTTPTDLARWIIALQRIARGDDGILSRATIARMMTPVAGSAGLGVFRDGPWFEHGGSNRGFKGQFFGHLTNGSGAVVLTNGDGGAMLTREILHAIGAVYGWPGELQTAGSRSASAEELARCVGRYEDGDGNGNVLRVALRDGVLRARTEPASLVSFYPVEGGFLEPSGGGQLRFGSLGEGGYETVVVTEPRADQRTMTRLPADAPRGPAALLADGDVERAIEMLRARAAEPERERVRLGPLLRTLGNEGQLEAALAVARLATDLDPDGVFSWHLRAEYAEHCGDLSEATTCWNRVLRSIEASTAPESTRNLLERTARSGLRRAAATQASGG